MKFSITIPAYKQKYLYEAIESCLAQTYKDFELIIVDDASPEDLKSVVDKFQDSRVRYYRNERNCGALNVVDNWNICLGYAKGDYVICMGDDDKLLSNCLEEYVKLIEKYPNLNVYHGMTEIIDENSHVYDLQEVRPERENVSSMMYNRFKHGRLQYIGDWLFNTRYLRSVGGFYKMPFAWGSDDLTAYTAAVGSGVANSQTPIFQYRVSSLTISKGGYDKEKIEAINMMEQPLHDILIKDKQINPEWSSMDVVCEKYIPKYIERRRNGQLLNLFIHNGCKSLIWWLANGSKYKISKKQVLISYIKSLNK